MNLIPTITKNLLIINVLCFFASIAFRSHGIDLDETFGLHFVLASNFQPWQFFTYMFMHAGWQHLFFNMFSLWMFGRTLEYEMGWKRFLTYYMVCGVGAAIAQIGVAQIDFANMEVGSMAWYNYMGIPTVGASGAVFGLLLAFGMMHPNALISLIFPPITLKAKWFVIIYGVLELFLGVSGNMDNVARGAG